MRSNRPYSATLTHDLLVSCLNSDLSKARKFNQYYYFIWVEKRQDGFKFFLKSNSAKWKQLWWESELIIASLFSTSSQRWERERKRKNTKNRIAYLRKIHCQYTDLFYKLSLLKEAILYKLFQFWFKWLIFDWPMIMQPHKQELIRCVVINSLTLIVTQIPETFNHFSIWLNT